MLDTDPAAAARAASAILVGAPAQTEATLLLAAALRRLGDPARAVDVLGAVVAAHPGSPVMELEFGRACAAAGRGGEATAAFRRAVALDAELAEGWRELAAQLFAAGDTAAGDAAYANYERRMPDPPGLNDTLGALAEGRVGAAEVLLRERLARAPGDVLALRLLAQAATHRNDLAEAERLLNECLEIAPGFARARFDLAGVLFSLQQPDKVLALLERLLALDPAHWACRLLKARTLTLVDRSDEAIALLDRAVAEHPEDDGSWLLLGHVRRELGHQAEAIEAYRRALALRPDSGEVYWSLANLKTVPLTAADVEAIRGLLARTTLLDPDRARLEFALGKALEDDAQYAESFAHYARGNALHRATLGYDADAARSAVRRSAALYTTEFYGERRGWGSDRADPIFVVGVPRSGSTLLEQMLASHPQVEGTRELSELSIVITGLAPKLPPGTGPAYPDWVASLRREQVEAAAKEYLERTRVHRPLGRPRFIDKMPANFGHLGLIRLMFPRAAVIDARRHPLDCAFSCYKQLFAYGAAFSYDLAELGGHVRDYTELMAHFDMVLPGYVHRVYYERLVADPEAELTALLGHCGLPFDPACLRFHENRRIVQSVSSEQVRQPLNAEGVGRWRSYEAWLGPLKAALGDLVERYPAAEPGAPRAPH